MFVVVFVDIMVVGNEKKRKKRGNETNKKYYFQIKFNLMENINLILIVLKRMV
jgi:hypothetical protein